MRLTQPQMVEGKERRYGRLVVLVEDGPIILAFPIRKTYRPPSVDVESYAYRNLSPTAVEIIDQNSGPVSVGGSSGCESGSLQSGGNHSYCTCDGCF